MRVQVQVYMCGFRCGCRCRCICAGAGVGVGVGVDVDPVDAVLPFEVGGGVELTDCPDPPQAAKLTVATPRKR